MTKSIFHAQRGVGLIEVLVTVLILATSLIALAALQTRSLQFNQGAYMRSQANIFAYDILDRIRINRNNIANYNVGLAPFNLTAAPVTAPLAAADLDQWRRAIATALPDGEGAVACNNVTSICTLTIRWTELTAEQGEIVDQQGNNRSRFTYTARI